MVIKQKVNLHIERLVLHGFARGDRHRIGKAVELELARLIAEQGVPSTLSGGGELALSDAGAFNLSSNSKADVIGNQIAQSVYSGFDNE